MKYRKGLDVLTVLTGLMMAASVDASVTHRYSFTSDVTDSVGSAHGTLQGNAAIVDGAATFDGAAETFINLPPGLITGQTNLTVEFWASFGTMQDWSRVFDFGDTNGTVGRYYVMFCPHSGAGDYRMSYADADPGYNHELVVTGPGILDNTGPTHFACVYDPPTGLMALYTNGVLANYRTDLTFPLSSISNVYSFLGKSTYTGDAPYNGTIDEFRIYDKALNAVEVAGSYAAGTSTLSTDPGAVQNLNLAAETVMIVGNSQGTTLTADFAGVQGVRLFRMAGVTYESSNPSVLTVSQEGKLQALTTGSSTITASYGGKSTGKVITVNRREALVIAGTLYVDLKADDSSAGTLEWVNLAPAGNFTEVGDPVMEADVAGTGVSGVLFNGTTDAYVGPNTTDDIDGNSDRSVEIWALNPSIASEETLVATSHRGSDHRNFSVNYGSNGSYGAAGLWADDLGWSGPAPVAGAWHHIVFTYDGAGVAKVYADGILKTRKVLAASLSTYPGEPIKLGAQTGTDGTSLDFGQAFSGYIAAVRFHGGLLSDDDVFNNFLYGPKNQSPGTLAGIVTRADAKVLLNGYSQAKAFANFTVKTNVDVSTFAVYSSSDTNVILVETNGLIRGVGVGKAEVIASYSGYVASAQVEVVETFSVTLKHRYSFSEAAGSVEVADLVGTAKATVAGGAALTGSGQVTLDGASGYVDLPNGIISVLTNATFETWATWNGGSVWQRVFDFGSNASGEDQQGNGTTYIMLTPQASGAGMRFEATLGNGSDLLNTTAMPTNKECHIVVTYNYSARMAKLYVDGLLVATNALTVSLNDIEDINNWLGRSNWPDPFFNGSFNEFRIYDGILTDVDVALSGAAGPDKVLSGSSGSLQTVEFKVPSTNLVLNGLPLQATFIGNYQYLTNVNITGFQGVAFESSNPNVATISAKGVIESLAEGTTVLKATYQGKEAMVNLSVVRSAGSPAQLQLLHRYSFSEAVGSATTADSVGGSDGNVVGGAVFSGDGKLTLNGSDAYVNLPNGMISVLSNATFEAWVYWTGNRDWERIFDFGSNAGGEDVQGTGDTYLLLSPRAGSGRVRATITITSNSAGSETPILEDTGALPRNVWSHVALSYDITAGFARLYVNGKKVSTGIASIPLSGLNDINNWLGRSNWPDPYFTGQFDEFRIYEGALVDSQIAATYAAGPDALPSANVMPQLGAVRSGTTITISWPADATGYELEYTTSLGTGAVWQKVNTSAVVEGGVKKVTLSTTGDASFYRLKK